MHNRRSFLKTSGALALAGLLPSISNANSLFGYLAAKYPPVGIQTYTLNFLLNGPDVDTKAVLKQIADIGVKELETATGTATGLYYGHKPKEFSAMVKDLGMTWVGNHYSGLPRTRTTPPAAASGAVGAIATPPTRPTMPGGPRTNLAENLQQIVDESAEGGCSWVVCSSSAESTMDEIKKTTEIFAKAGEAARKNKMKFAYHNHQSEFAKVDGISAYDYILTNTNKNEVYMELDLAWAFMAGMDPVAMFKQYPNRFPLWHVKDIDPTTKRPCPVGAGQFDFKRVFENSKLSGVQHTFIEQDGAKTIDDPAASIKWLKANVYV
ncbi:TIM barrel protein [Adhaeribacter radiodurans]|uniref:TIM barrel protein n=1 Tax=Adhaeribacter radiodurans TaxID=2745197 RepID=A0A7L7L7W4_9BACT|nr:TIM barrel protein [Adhaeribacter radiodurans]QMU28853.1 TIM barrel protein [Adhaeribacter radiodurans]